MYLLLRGRALTGTCLMEAGPLLVLSLRVKWDETQQELKMEDPVSGAKCLTIPNIMVTTGHFKTTLLEIPKPLAYGLSHLARQTADTMLMVCQRHRVLFWTCVRVSFKHNHCHMDCAVVEV